jgi:hypothetical protein
MKMLLWLFSMVLSFCAFASTVDTKTFVYDGSVNSIELILNAEKSHTEYRIESRETTCFREVVVGYNTICSGGYRYPMPYPHHRRPFPGTYPYPSRYPAPAPQQCWSQPIYRTVPYACIQTLRIPYEVKDYDVDARVIVDVTNLSQLATPGETFKVTLAGDNLSFDVNGSKKFFVIKKRQDVRASMTGAVKMIDALLVAELIEAEPVLKAIKMTNISLVNDKLIFDIGPVASRDNLGFELKIAKVKTFGSDTVLLERELLPTEVEVTASSAGSVAGVNVEKLGVELKNGKFSLMARTFAKFKGSLMNSSQFENLSASRTLIFKIR